jgi:hypothetical protein
MALGKWIQVTPSDLDAEEGDGICYEMHCSVQAGGCGAEMHGDSKEEVLSKWNTRAKPEGEKHE